MVTRRYLLGRASNVVGAAALGALLQGDKTAAKAHDANQTYGLPALPHIAPTAKRVISLFQSGGPSTIDLFDYKPNLQKLHGTPIPDSVRMGQRLAQTAGQQQLPVAAPMFRFQRCGERGAWVSELLPHTKRVVDHLAIIKSVHTEAINHDPAITFIQTGSQQLGHPSIGSWVSYGLGSENQNLPAYVVLISYGEGNSSAQPLFARLWGNGYLPSVHQGVKLRSSSEPVAYLNNPPGINRSRRRRWLDALSTLNAREQAESGDPETATRIAQYEMAFRMQASAPSLIDLTDESENTFQRYGPDVRQPGKFARNCLLARRLCERGVRFVQLFHRGWDTHNNLPHGIRLQCHDTDQPIAALIQDLKERGLLDETLVVWGGEFGRTIFCQGQLTSDNYGRDHHGRCFAIWMAGGGVRGGADYGKSDDYCYNIAENPVHIRDVNATILHCLGIDHEQFIFPFRGLDQRLTGVEDAHVVRAVLS